MRFSIGTILREGPWGGGNQVARALKAHLEAHGDAVSTDLSDPDLDVLVMWDPRRRSQNFVYGAREIFRYLRCVNPRALVVHRVNECDERKGTTGVNLRMRRANRCADHTVFVSSWLRELFLKQGMPCPSSSVVLNGADRAIFHNRGYNRWNGTGPLKLVTHHWGGNWMKGFDIYQRLDEMLIEEKYRGRIEFTYIGNLPEGFRFRNARYLEPCHGEKLAALVRANHVYVTASRNEPGSNHQNEGGCCGLPLLYIESGGMPEYCEGYGVSFTPDEFDEKLDEMMRTYPQWADRMSDYPQTAERMCAEYRGLFEDLVARRGELIGQRDRWRQWRWRLARGEE